MTQPPERHSFPAHDPYQSPPPYPAQPQQVYVVQTPARPTSTPSVIALVLSILGLVIGCCTFGLFSFLGVILGHIGIADTKGDLKAGRGMAVAALVMGYLGIAPALFLSITWFIGAVTGAGHSSTTP